MRIGLISDTHVPYRAPELPPGVFKALRDVELILHAGDVDDVAALDELRALAPVYAVRGNFHVLDGSAAGATLPEAVELELAGFRVALTHGHRIGPLALAYKGLFVLQRVLGRRDFLAYDRAIVHRLLRRFPNADVIVFGHTHRFYEAWWGNTLVVNPGPALFKEYFNWPIAPSVAHLLLEPGQRPAVTRIPL